MVTKRKPEKQPWYPRIEEPVEFHDGVPPRDLIGEFVEPAPVVDEIEDEEPDAPASK